jgi:triosephosphate isomerase
MIIDAGAHFVILGHSERRRYFNETDQLINKKVVRAINSGLKVILCVGEDSEQRQSGRQKEIVQNQIEHGLKNLPYTNKILIAYEPTWAIGTGVPATPAVIQEMHSYCREKLVDLWEDKAKKVSILYGGSVNNQNAKAMLDQPDIDGLLVGTASLSLESFSKIVNYNSVSVQL